MKAQKYRLNKVIHKDDENFFYSNGFSLIFGHNKHSEVYGILTPDKKEILAEKGYCPEALSKREGIKNLLDSNGNLLEKGFYQCDMPSGWEFKSHLVYLTLNKSKDGFIAEEFFADGKLAIPGQLVSTWFTPRSPDDYIKWMQRKSNNNNNNN